MYHTPLPYTFPNTDPQNIVGHFVQLGVRSVLNLQPEDHFQFSV